MFNASLFSNINKFLRIVTSWISHDNQTIDVF